MIQLAVCDDEKDALELIVNQINKVLTSFTEYECFATTNPEEIIELSKVQKVDILFIDIQMPNYNGFEIVNKLNKRNHEILTIFITNLNMYVYESFKFHPFRFIRKSHIKEIKEALISATKQIKAREDIFTVPVNSNLTFEVRVNEIIYFESMHNYVKIVTLKGDNTFRSTLKSIESLLKNKGFVRINSGVLLNIRYVYVINSNTVVINYGNPLMTFPVSRSKKGSLVNAYRISLR